MTALSIQPTYPIFTDIDGQPLEAGYIFIGIANLQPIGNPVAVYWDAALTQPAAQPIRTIGGYPANNGTPARLYVNSDYSIQVQNRNGSVVYSAPAATERYSGEVIEITFNDVTGTLGLDRTTGQLGSDRVNFLQAGTGAVTRTAQAKMRDVVNVRDFGTIGNSSTGDDAVFQAAIDYISKISDDTGVQGTLEFTGTIYLASPKKFGKNIRLVGGGRSFNSVIAPLASFSGSYLFSIDGDDCIGGFAFRVRHEGFTINNSLIATKAQIPITYVIDKAYDIALRDVWLYNVRGTGIQISNSNYVLIEDCSLYGVTNSPADSEYAILILSGGAGGGGSGVKIINPDIEVWFKGILPQSTSRVELINAYCERNIICWESTNTSSGSFTVVGGQFDSPGASGVAANLASENTTVIGGMYKANGGSGLIIDPTSRRNNVNLIGVAGDITDSRNYAEKIVADATRWYPSKVQNQKDVSDAVATNFYNIICPFNAAFFGVCEVTVNARDLSGYSLWTARYRFAFTNPDNTLRVTPITEYGKANVNISANYSLAITTALSTAGTTITFQITADSGGALGNGQSPRISTEAEMVQWDSTGAMYIQAV